MSDFEPLAHETPLEFVERADSMGISEPSINAALKEHYGLVEDGEVKALKLKSRVFWQEFFLAHVKNLHEQGGSRYAAVRFIERKSGTAGQPKLTAQQIDDLVDSVGAWQR